MQGVDDQHTVEQAGLGDAFLRHLVEPLHRERGGLGVGSVEPGERQISEQAMNVFRLIAEERIGEELAGFVGALERDQSTGGEQHRRTANFKEVGLVFDEWLKPFDHALIEQTFAFLVGRAFLDDADQRVGTDGFPVAVVFGEQRGVVGRVGEEVGRAELVVLIGPAIPPAGVDAFFGVVGLDRQVAHEFVEGEVGEGELLDELDRGGFEEFFLFGGGDAEFIKLGGGLAVDLQVFEDELLAQIGLPRGTVFVRVEVVDELAAFLGGALDGDLDERRVPFHGPAEYRIR